MKYKLLTLLLLATLPAFSAQKYLWQNAPGTGTGTSWDNAYKTADAVSLSAGDTLDVGAGTYGYFNVNNPGNAGAPILIRAAQDGTHSGVAYFTGGIDSIVRHYVTIDGGYNGAQNFDVTGGINMNDSDYPWVKNVYVHDAWCGIYIGGGDPRAGGTLRRGGGVWNCRLAGIYNEAGIKCVGRNITVDGFDQFSISNCIIQVNCFAGTLQVNGGITGDGSGPDGIQGCWGMTVTDCVFSNAVGNLTPIATNPDRYQHQDMIQVQSRWVKIMRNKWVNGSADSCIDYDTYNGQPVQVWIANNEFHLIRGGGIRFYPSSGAPYNTLTGVHILNNTFVDHLSGHQWAISSQYPTASLSISDVLMQNNIFVNCSDLINMDLGGAAASGLNFDYNDINAGANGITTVTINGSSYTQAHPRTGMPTFVGYTPAQVGANVQLAASDTAAKDQGTPQTDISTDFLGVSRPQGPAWDIGAYEYASGSTANTNPIISISPLAIDYGWLCVDATSNATVTVANVGSNTLFGAANATYPWTIVGTSTYALTNGQSTNFVVRYAPTNQEAHLVSQAQQGTVTFTGGGDSSVTVSGLSYSNHIGSTIYMTNTIVVSPMYYSADTVPFITCNLDSGGGVPSDGYSIFGFTNAVGLYRLQGLVRAEGDSANSFYIGLNQPATSQADVWDITNYTIGFENRYVSLRGTNGTFNAPQYPDAVFSLTNTTNFIVIYYREAVTALSSLTLIPVNTNPPANPPAITVQPLNTRVVQGSNATLTVSASGTAPLVYQWKKDDSNISNATNTTYGITNAVAVNAGAYTVVITNSAGSITSSVANVTVVTPPVVYLNAASTNVAIGQPFSLTFGVSNALVSVLYHNAVGFPPGVTNYTTSSAQLSDNGVYDLVAFNEAGWVVSRYATVKVYTINNFRATNAVFVASTNLPPNWPNP